MTTPKKKVVPTPNEVRAQVSEQATEAAKLTQAGVPKSEEEMVAARAADNDATTDDRFRRTFVLQERAWKDIDESKFDDAHEANKVALLQDALNVGLHPTGEAVFDGLDRECGYRSVGLKYSVPVRVAALSDKPTADVVTPSNALKDMPGGTTAQSTLPDQK
jgi:hypothetical protein